MNTFESIQLADPVRFLRRSLCANAAFSTLSGLGFIAAPATIARMLGDLPPGLVATVGVQLVIFAAALAWMASRPVISRPLTWAVILADLSWVIGTAVVVKADLLSPDGAIAASVLADVVLVLAMLQSFGLYRISVQRKEARS